MKNSNDTIGIRTRELPDFRFLKAIKFGAFRLLHVAVVNLAKRTEVRKT